MRLYKFTFTHFAPKDYSHGIRGYLIAANDRAVFEHLDERLGWTEDYEYDDERIARISEIMENCGNWDDELNDLYYGADQHGWSDEGGISGADIAVLIRLGIAERI